MPTTSDFVRALYFVSKVALFNDFRRLGPGLSQDVVPSMFFPQGVQAMTFEGIFNLVKAAMVFTRLGEDVAVIDFHMAPQRSGLIADSPATTDEMDKIDARLDTLWNALNGFYPAEFAYDRLVFHNAGPKVTNAQGKTLYPDGTLRSATPAGPAANPALRTIIKAGQAGDSAADAILPPQVAESVTFKTALRREWGRVYVPAGDVNMLQTGVTHSGGAGQIGASHVASLADAFGALLNGLAADDVPQVVWSAKHQLAISVDSIQVDSLFDVIRSRRYDRPIVKEERLLA